MAEAGGAEVVDQVGRLVAVVAEDEAGEQGALGRRQRPRTVDERAPYAVRGAAGGVAVAVVTDVLHPQLAGDVLLGQPPAHVAGRGAHRADDGDALARLTGLQRRGGAAVGPCLQMARARPDLDPHAAGQALRIGDQRHHALIGRRWHGRRARPCRHGQGTGQQCGAEAQQRRPPRQQRRRHDDRARATAARARPPTRRARSRRPVPPPTRRSSLFLAVERDRGKRGPSLCERGASPSITSMRVHPDATVAVPAGPIAYRRRLRSVGPFMALAPPFVALVAAASLWRFTDCSGESCVTSGAAGWLLAAMALPTSLVVGMPWEAGSVRYVVTGVTSALVWMGLGYLAARRRHALTGGRLAGLVARVRVVPARRVGGRTGGPRPPRLCGAAPRVPVATPISPPAQGRGMRRAWPGRCRARRGGRRRP